MTAELFEASYTMAHRLGLETVKQRLVEGYAKELCPKHAGVYICWDKERYEKLAKEKLEACL